MDSQIDCTTRDEFYETIRKLYESGVIFHAFADCLTILVKN